MARKNREFSETEKEIYRLGFLNGESQLRQANNVIRTVNSHLMDELQRLDIEKPVLGDPNHITITFKGSVLTRIIKELQKKPITDKGSYYAKKLQKHINKHEKRQRIAAARIQEGLQEALNK